MSRTASGERQHNGFSVSYLVPVWVLALSVHRIALPPHQLLQNKCKCGEVSSSDRFAPLILSLSLGDALATGADLTDGTRPLRVGASGSSSSARLRVRRSL
jgi:hypothetical protein